MKILFRILCAALFITAGITPAIAQQQLVAADPLMKIYRATPTWANDVIHTRLDVRFDYKKRYMYGKEWEKRPA